MQEPLENSDLTIVGKIVIFANRSFLLYLPDTKF